MVEGAPHTAKRSKGSIVVSQGGASLPEYKGVEEGAGQGGWRAQGGSPTPTGSRTPLFPIRSRRGKEEEGGRKERGGGRPPSQFGLGLGGHPSLAPFPSFPLRPNKAHIPPEGFR